MDNCEIQFQEAFKDLTGNEPFPWQQALYGRFIADGPDNIPATCNLPTGLGKTSVIAVWLIALAQGAKVPRRLVYVVNRRTVVDQTTAEVEKYRKAIESLDSQHPLKQRIDNLAISTLRGQFADNREWSADPARPAVICGTVDMIGSRLLFSGYGVGFRGKPLHAGFLGQDALLVHDEAHLEPAFQKLIKSIKCEQERCREFAKFHVMELTATTRSGEGQTTASFTPAPSEPGRPRPDECCDPHPASTFTLTQDDKTHPIVKQRIEATKHLQPHQAKDDAKIAEEIADLALEQRWVKDEKGENIKDENGDFKDANVAVLIFVRTLDDVKKVCDKLTNKKDGVSADHVQPLTGTMRGLERDALADRDPVFMRFLPKKNRNPDVKPADGTAYLVCTSAGEVGIDISADHMVCDLSTFESMAQRFGRVNRYGERADTRIDVVHPTPDGFDEKHPLTPARKATLKLLGRLDGDASPLKLGTLDAQERQAAFAPPPTILPATDILFDAWALTSIREKMPGRTPVEPYLHGLAEWQPPETHVAWRNEVEIVTDELLDRHPPADLLDDYPLKPHELLRDATDRKNTGVFAQLSRMARRLPEADIWIMDAQGEVKAAKLQDVINGDSRRLYGATIILPPSIGGLTAAGTLDGDVQRIEGLSYDVADIPASSTGARIRVWSDDPDYDNKTADMRRVRNIEISASEEDENEPRRWDWYESLPLEGGRTAKRPVTWKTHVSDVVNHAKQIVADLSLPPDIAAAIVLAAELHDHGKRRERFQITLGNRHYPAVLLAKAGRRGARLPEPFRHEFASVLDAQADARFNNLSDEMKDLVLHLIAAHHGRARPHFPVDEAFDPEHPSNDAEAMAIETPGRFARLQRRYGRWGLAYLESLLRAADWAASAAPSKVLDANGNEVTP